MSDTEDTFPAETGEEQQETVEESESTPQEMVEDTEEESVVSIPQDTIEETETGGDEAVHVLEDVARRKAEKLEDELEEYKEMRKEEKLKEAESISELKRKKIERQSQRIDEEKRLNQSRIQEDVRRKAEEEERKKKKIEEEIKRKAERERKRKEAEKRKGPKTPNYKIIKKQSDGTEIEEEVEKKTPQKSKEQLEQEKQAILAQRITPLELDGLNLEALVESAKELHQKLWNLISSKYELEERFQRQQYDMVELAERARMMSKVKKRGIASAQVDDTYDRNTDKHNNAPPKILLCSKYERHTDSRSFGERQRLYEEKLLQANEEGSSTMGSEMKRDSLV